MSVQEPTELDSQHKRSTNTGTLHPMEIEDLCKGTEWFVYLAQVDPGSPSNSGAVIRR